MTNTTPIDAKLAKVSREVNHLKRKLKDATVRRNQIIGEAHRAGLTDGNIAHIAGISRQQAYNINRENKKA